MSRQNVFDRIRDLNLRPQDREAGTLPLRYPSRELCEVATDLSLVVSEGDAEGGHGAQDGHQRLDGVAVDDGSVLLEVLRREPTLVYNSETDTLS